MSCHGDATGKVRISLKSLGFILWEHGWQNLITIQYMSLWTKVVDQSTDWLMLGSYLSNLQIGKHAYMDTFPRWIEWTNQLARHAGLHNAKLLRVGRCVSARCDPVRPVITDETLLCTCSQRPKCESFKKQFNLQPTEQPTLLDLEPGH